LKCAYDPRSKKEASWTFGKDKFVDITDNLIEFEKEG